MNNETPSFQFLQQKVSSHKEHQNGSVQLEPSIPSFVVRTQTAKTRPYVQMRHQSVLTHLHQIHATKIDEPYLPIAGNETNHKMATLKTEQNKVCPFRIPPNEQVPPLLHKFLQKCFLVNQLYEIEGFNLSKVFESLHFTVLKGQNSQNYTQNKQVSQYYIGEVQNNVRHGRGIWVRIDEQLDDQCIPQLANTDKSEFQYQDLINNAQQGRIQKAVNGPYHLYVGNWLNDLRHGFGVEVFSNKSIFRGQYINDTPHGSGILVWPNGQTYQGEWKLGKRHGKGKWKGVKGDTYQGNWKGGLADGRGIHTWINGDYYQGQMVRGQKEGFGREIFSGSGDSYQGYYKSGKPHGYGQYKWSNGAFYKGNFSEGLRHGQGFWKQSRGQSDMYQGQFEKDLKHGYGIFTWASGNIYKGEFSYNKRQGHGEMFWNDGSIYRGEWKDGERHGLGSMFHPLSGQKRGLFEASNLVSEYETLEPSSEQPLGVAETVEQSIVPPIRTANNRQQQQGNIRRAVTKVSQKRTAKNLNEFRQTAKTIEVRPTRRYAEPTIAATQRTLSLRCSVRPSTQNSNRRPQTRSFQQDPSLGSFLVNPAQTGGRLKAKSTRTFRGQNQQKLSKNSLYTRLDSHFGEAVLARSIPQSSPLQSVSSSTVSYINDLQSLKGADKSGEDSFAWRIHQQLQQSKQAVSERRPIRTLQGNTVKSNIGAIISVKKATLEQNIYQQVS